MLILKVIHILLLIYSEYVFSKIETIEQLEIFSPLSSGLSAVNNYLFAPALNKGFSAIRNYLTENPTLIQKENEYLSSITSILPAHSDPSENSQPPTKDQNKTLEGYIRQSKKIAQYAAATYCTDKTIMQWNCAEHCISPTNIKVVFKDKQTKTKGYIGINDIEKTIVIAFRGTFNFDNVLVDFKFIRTYLTINPMFESSTTDYNTANKAKGILVHRGFLQAANVLYAEYVEDLKNIINHNKYKDYKLLFTGHSLGASIASLSAVLVKIYLNLPWSKMELFTYGEPRTGDYNYALLIDQSGMRTIRAINKNDIIPALPPSIFGFHHHNRELWVKDNNTDVMCSERSTEDPYCSISESHRSFLNHIHIWDTNFLIEC